MIPKIDHINRYVSDVERHITFYRDALGYELIDRGTKDTGSRYAILKGSDHELFFTEKDDIEADKGNFRHMGYSTDNAGELLKKMKKAGFAGEDQEIIVKEYSRQFYIKDPDGFEIDIIQWTGKERFFRDLEKKEHNLRI